MNSLPIRSVCAGVVSLLLASGAQAVFLNPDGTGQVLLYPYYTVNAGNDTLLSVVNTTSQGKALKVRFMEGRNSRTVLDFNLYLSPFDVWTAALTTVDGSPSSPAVLTTSDSSCTVPDIRFSTSLPTFPGSTRRYVRFQNFQYAGSDAGTDSLERTREGHFEIIEMGVVTNHGLPGTLDSTLNTLRNITHIGTGLPRDCSTVNGNWTIGATGRPRYTPDGASQTLIDTDAPSGGLLGSASVVNVSQGTYINYRADALEDFRASSFHTGPAEPAPTLASANNAPERVVTDAFGTIPRNGARSIRFIEGQLVVQNWPSEAGIVRSNSERPRAIDAVSAVLAQDTIFNEYVSSGSIGAASEWVVSFPTKQFYVDQALIGPQALKPFSRLFPAATNPDGMGDACVDSEFSVSDRAGFPGLRNTSFTPIQNVPLRGLCYSTQVIRFNPFSGPSAILGSTDGPRVVTDGSEATAGWAAIRFKPEQTQNDVSSSSSCTGTQCEVGAQSSAYLGLPSTGFWALTIANLNAQPGVRGNYGGAFRQRGQAACSGPACTNALNQAKGVSLSSDGVGQVLLYPYYTANGGNDTLISVVNTKAQAKALKVRFLEAHNGRSVLDFNLYLAAFDVWTGAITTASSDVSMPAVLTTSDTSCTVPDVIFNSELPTFAGSPRRYVSFSNRDYAGSDAGIDGLARTREGFVEVIEMGEVTDGAPNGASLNTLSNISMINGVVNVGSPRFVTIPRDCARVNANWRETSGVSAYRPNGGPSSAIDMAPPTGGLFGGASVVHVANGTYINFEAEALANFRVTPIHTGPDDALPSLASVNHAPDQAIVDAFGAIPAGGARSVVVQSGRVVVQNWPSAQGIERSNGQRVRAVDAVSAVLAQERIFNEYVAEPTLGAASEWVMTFPTKRFYVDQVAVGEQAVLPFTQIFPTSSTPDGVGRACVDVEGRVYNREEGASFSTGFDFPTMVPATRAEQLCFQSQVLTFGQGGLGLFQPLAPQVEPPGQSVVLGSSFARNVTVSQTSSFQNPNSFSQQSGWFTLRFAGTPRSQWNISNASCTGVDCSVGAQSTRYTGLPVIGFWALTIANNNAAPGVRGHYGGAFRHRGLRTCVLSATNNQCFEP